MRRYEALGRGAEVILAGQAFEPDPYLADPDILDRLPLHQKKEDDASLTDEQKDAVSAKLVHYLKGLVNLGEISQAQADALYAEGWDFINRRATGTKA